MASIETLAIDMTIFLRLFDDYIMFLTYIREYCMNSFVRVQAFSCYLYHYSVIHCSLVIIKTVWVVMVKMGLIQPYPKI